MNKKSHCFWQCLVVGAVVLLGTAAYVPGQETVDLIIKNGRIVDGSGKAAFTGDIAVKDGVIIEVGKISASKAQRMIDAKGRVVAPGFIDMMGQNSGVLVTDRAAAESKIRQGITTLLVGEVRSVAPRNAKKPLSGFDQNWSSFAEYFQLLEEKKIPINVIHNVCGATLRGGNKSDPTAEQLEWMKGHVEQAMKDGCVGFSVALIYPPMVYSKTEELIELAKVAAKYDGVYFAHVRSESGQLLEAIEESVRIGKEADIAIHIYHLKAAGQDNWPLMAGALERLSKARRGGMEATADIYPYDRNWINLRSFIHPRHYAKGRGPDLSDPEIRKQLRREIETDTNWENWYNHVGKNWDNVMIMGKGKSVQEAADEQGVDVWDAFFDLAKKGTGANAKSMNEEQKRQALRAPFVCISTDTDPINRMKRWAHPRAFGTFPRVLAKYVRQEKIISLEEAVRKMTSLPASILRMDEWGMISEGKVADMVIFDPEKVQDKATYKKPLEYPEGIDYVIVSGQAVLDEGQITGALPGKVIRHNRKRK